MSTENWVEIGVIGDVPQNGARVVKTEFGNIGVFRTVDDEIFAIEDRCPHLDGILTAGIVHGGQVTCPLHNWVIDLKTGNVLGPDEGCVLTMPVRHEQGKIFIELSSVKQMAKKELI